MSSPVFRSDMGVELVKASASDADVVWSARVSTQGEASLAALDADPGRSAGLIRYLMSNRHGTPFEHNSMTFLVTAPIFVFREFQRHRIGWCLPGDARIALGRSGRTRRIADLHRDWYGGAPDPTGRTRLLPSGRDLVARTLDTETGVIEAARVVDVLQSGIKPIIRLEVDSGRVLRCTPEHRVWSPEGWVQAGDVSVDDLLGRQGRVPVGGRRGVPTRRRAGVQVGTARAPGHQLTTSAEGLGDGERRRALTLGVRFERVVSVRSAGQEMTYDLEMPGPWHNFIADDFVVHNSYNEESGRYRELEPVFYVPGPDRRLRQEGKPGHYEFVDGGPELTALAVEATTGAYAAAHAAYRQLLDAGVAREVARAVLPVGTYSSMYATCNARSLMAFLSLRTQAEGSTFPSYPQREIEMVAEQMEVELARLMPLTHAAFVTSGRVSP